MKVNRGDVVILNYPFSSGSGARVRPALVVQPDQRNRLLTSTIVAMITSNVTRVGADPTQLFIDVSTPEGQQSGLRVNSAVTCGNLFTIDERLIRQKIGELPDAVMQQVDVCLKEAVGIR